MARIISTLKNLFTLAFALSIAITYGCSADTAFHNIVIEPEEINQQAKMGYTPIEGKSVVYLIKNQVALSEFGSRIYASVGIDSRLVGMLSVNSYFKLILDPGTHYFQAFNSVHWSHKNAFSNIGKIGEDYKFNFEPNKVYFISVEFGNIIFNPITQFVLMSEESAHGLLKLPRFKLARFSSDISLEDERSRLLQTEKEAKERKKLEENQQKVSRQASSAASSNSSSNILEDVLGILLIGFLIFGIAASGYHSAAPPQPPNLAMMNLQQTMISRPVRPVQTQDNYSYKSSPYSYKEAPYSFNPSKTSGRQAPELTPRSGMDLSAPQKPTYRQNPLETTTYYGKNGIDWKVDGNRITSSDGQRYRLEGDSIYSQTGKRYRIDGSSIIGEDGSRCKVVVNTVYCD